MQDSKVALDFVDAAGQRHHLTILPAESVQSLPALTKWIAQSEALLSSTGVPPREGAHLYDALIRAAAAAAATQ